MSGLWTLEMEEWIDGWFGSEHLEELSIQMSINISRFSISIILVDFNMN